MDTLETICKVDQSAIQNVCLGNYQAAEVYGPTTQRQDSRWAPLFHYDYRYREFPRK